ncbi:FtsB family cell division protein [Georgenia ruanii]|uniref:FtsB family cell division protein n=1 Tax=Georgenia ruanii TaxID=348442 RepID=UPI00186B3D08|nr:septum formation initiator family protein [Georgenia ruanii]
MTARRPTAPRTGQSDARAGSGRQTGGRTTASAGSAGRPAPDPATSAKGGRPAGPGRARPAGSRPAGAPRTATRGAGPAGPSGRSARKGPAAQAARSTAAAPRGSGKGRTRRAVTFGDDGAPSPTITLRALGIFLVCLVAFAVLAPTLRFAVAQQEQLRALNTRVSDATARNAELEKQLALWQDEQYVQAQARDRLGYVMPGETPYVVVDPERVTGGQSKADAEAEHREEARVAATPWYLHMWDSVQVAGESVTGEDADPSGLVAPEPTPSP